MTMVPVEEYLRTTYEPDMEYVNGQLVERHVGEYFHSRTQLLIAAILESREDKRGFSAFTEQRVQVSDEPRYRIPDLCVKALPHEATPVLVRPTLSSKSFHRMILFPTCSPKSASTSPPAFPISG